MSAHNVGLSCPPDFTRIILMSPPGQAAATNAARVGALRIQPAPRCLVTRADLPPKPTRALISHTHPITAGPQTRARSRRALELERAVTIANDLIKGLSELIDPLRTPALARAWKTLEAERPPGTVHGWARRAHTSRATLWREWKSLGLPDMLTLSFLVRSAFLRSRLTSDHEENSPPPAPQINEFDKRRCRRLARQIIAVGVMLGYADDDSAKGQA